MGNDTGADPRGGFKVVGAGETAQGTADPQAAAQASEPGSELRALRPRIIVLGLGGAGGNAVHNMIEGQLEGVELYVANTDAQALEGSICSHRLQLGRELTGGLGAGGRPEVGRAAAEESLEEVLSVTSGASLVFIAAGMGGGTGTGAAPVVAEAIRKKGVLTVAVVTKPFRFEGELRMEVAEQGIEALERHVDTLIVIPNQNLFKIATEKTSVADAFHRADNVLFAGVRGVTDLMVKPGLINLDFADFRSVMTQTGKAIMGAGEADGPRRAIDAAEAAMANPLLEDSSVDGARGVLINVTGGRDLTLFELDEAVETVRAVAHAKANIIVGSAFDEGLEGKIRVSVLATGILPKAPQAEAGAGAKAVSAAPAAAAPAQQKAPEPAPGPKDATQAAEAKRAAAPAAPAAPKADTAAPPAPKAEPATADADPPRVAATPAGETTPAPKVTAPPQASDPPQPAAEAPSPKSEAVELQAEARPREAPEPAEAGMQPAAAAAGDPVEVKAEATVATATAGPEPETAGAGSPEAAARVEPPALETPEVPDAQPATKTAANEGRLTLEDILRRAEQAMESKKATEAENAAGAPAPPSGGQSEPQPKSAPLPKSEPEALSVPQSALEPQSALKPATAPEPEAVAAPDVEMTPSAQEREPAPAQAAVDDEVDLDALIDEVLIRNRKTADPGPSEPTLKIPPVAEPTAPNPGDTSTDALLEDLAFSLASDDPFVLDEPTPEPAAEGKDLEALFGSETTDRAPGPALGGPAEDGPAAAITEDSEDAFQAELDRRARERARAALEALSDSHGGEDRAKPKPEEESDEALREIMNIPSFLRRTED
ncbi:MAG: cell division protein FtsZ [Kiloniellales bacterium]|nr:cell division protein FtsZ [Kiloniellales bacterium]